MRIGMQMASLRALCGLFNRCRFHGAYQFSLMKWNRLNDFPKDLRKVLRTTQNGSRMMRSLARNVGGNRPILFYDVELVGRFPQRSEESSEGYSKRSGNDRVLIGEEFQGKQHGQLKQHEYHDQRKQTKLRKHIHIFHFSNLVFRSADYPH